MMNDEHIFTCLLAIYFCEVSKVFAYFFFQLGCFIYIVLVVSVFILKL